MANPYQQEVSSWLPSTEIVTTSFTAVGVVFVLGLLIVLLPIGIGEAFPWIAEKMGKSRMPKDWDKKTDDSNDDEFDPPPPPTMWDDKGHR